MWGALRKIAINDNQDPIELGFLAKLVITEELYDSLTNPFSKKFELYRSANIECWWQKFWILKSKQSNKYYYFFDNSKDVVFPACWIDGFKIIDDKEFLVWNIEWVEYLVWIVWCELMYFNKYWNILEFNHWKSFNKKPDMKIVK